MLSKELKARVKAAAEHYRQRELDFLEMLGRIPNHRPELSKPRIRVKATSRPWYPTARS